MSLNHAVAGESGTEWEDRLESQQTESTPENKLENRLKNLERLADSIQAALSRQSFAGKLQALDLASDLRLKITDSWKMFQVAKLLREPARESMLSRVRYSVDELEEVVASHFGVEMT